MMRAKLIPLALFAIAAPLLAQMPTTPPGKPDPALATAGSYKVDSGHTQILWQVEHLGFSKFDGQFGGVTGTLKLDPAKPSESQVSVTIPINGLLTSVADLTRHLLAPDFFDVAKFPEATFVSTKVEAGQGAAAKITGNLTVHGITRPVTLDARFIGAGPGMMPPHPTNVGFEATTMIKRSDFGIKYGVPMVSDEVQLRINAAFEKTG